MKPKVAIVIAAGVLSFVLFGVGAILSLQLHPPDINFYSNVETPAPLRPSGLAFLTGGDILKPLLGVAGAAVAVHAPDASAGASNSYTQAAIARAYAMLSEAAAASISYPRAAIAPAYTMPSNAAAASISYPRAAIAPTYAMLSRAAAVIVHAVAAIIDTTSRSAKVSMFTPNAPASAQPAKVAAPLAKREQTKLPAPASTERTTPKTSEKHSASPKRPKTGGDGTPAKPKSGSDDAPAKPGNNAPPAPSANRPGDN